MSEGAVARRCRGCLLLMVAVAPVAVSCGCHWLSPKFESENIYLLSKHAQMSTCSLRYGHGRFVVGCVYTAESCGGFSE